MRYYSLSLRIYFVCRGLNLEYQNRWYIILRLNMRQLCIDLSFSCATSPLCGLLNVVLAVSSMESFSSIHSILVNTRPHP